MRARTFILWQMIISPAAYQDLLFTFSLVILMVLVDKILEVSSPWEGDWGYQPCNSWYYFCLGETPCSFLSDTNCQFHLDWVGRKGVFREGGELLDRIFHWSVHQNKFPICGFWEKLKGSWKIVPVFVIWSISVFFMCGYVYCVVLNLCIMWNSTSVPPNSPLDNIFNKWKEYSQKLLTKKGKILFFNCSIT